MNKIIKWTIITTAVLAVSTAVVYFSIINFGSENTPKAEEVDQNDIKVAAVGDSTTYGLRIDNWSENAYPHQLGEHLGEGYWVGNFGANNYAAMKSADFPYDETEEYNSSLEFNPDIIVIMLGTNDSKKINWQDNAQFKKEYKQLVEAYIDNNPEAEVYLATPPNAYNDADQPGDINNENINKVSAVVKEVSAEKEADLIDINQLTQEHRGWFQMDGIHPNAEGAKNIAEEVDEHISK